MDTKAEGIGAKAEVADATRSRPAQSGPWR